MFIMQLTKSREVIMESTSSTLKEALGNTAGKGKMTTGSKDMELVCSAVLNAMKNSQRYDMHVVSRLSSAGDYPVEVKKRAGGSYLMVFSGVSKEPYATVKFNYNENGSVTVSALDQDKGQRDAINVEMRDRIKYAHEKLDLKQKLQKK